MDVRKKLVELLGTVSCNGNGESLGCCPDRKYGICGEMANLSYCVIQNTANHLIAHGVTVQERGEWVYDHWREFKCSVCGEFSRSKPYKGKENYCPNCGAKMMPQPPEGE